LRLLQRPFKTADGRDFICWVGVAIVTIAGLSAPAQVAFAEATDVQRLGALALEALGLTVDSVEKQVIPRTLRAVTPI